ncbi:MAG: hypothetical protein IPL21_03435 [Saprospirales bacterium]|nr:hypothetical protein [Saprospirales bacterium]
MRYRSTPLDGGLPTAINSCTGRIFGNVVKNFMSYSQQLLFTQGQKTRMRDALESGTFPVANSFGALAPATVTPTCSITQTRGINPFCSDSTVQFKVTYSNNVGVNPSIEWFLNNVLYQYGETITIYGYSINNDDILSCKVKSSNTCAVPNPAISNQITLKKIISATPTIQISSQNIFSSYYICKDSAVTFNAIVTHGGTSPKYQWKKIM